MTSNTQFVTAAPSVLTNAYLSPNSDDWRLIADALEKRYSNDRPKWVRVLHPFTGQQYAHLTVIQAEQVGRMGENGYAFTLYNGGNGSSSNTYVEVYPARRFGVGKRIFKVVDVTTRTV